MFRIKSLSLENHQLLGNNNFDFCTKEYGNENPFISLIIGVNGTGKSRLLRFILEIFNNLIYSQRNGIDLISAFTDKFSIKYSIDNIEFEVSGEYKKIQLKKNGLDIKLNELQFPEKLIALTTNLNDRFPLYTKRSKFQNERYEYLGVRAASNNAFISLHVSRTAEHLVEIISMKKNLNVLQKLFDNLELTPKVKLVFKKGKNFKLFNDNFDPANKSSINLALRKIVEKFQNSSGYYQQNKSYRLDKYERIVSEANIDTDAVGGFFENHLLTNKLPSYNLDFISISENSTFLNEYQYLKVLSDLEVFSFDTIKLNKHTSRSGYFNIEEASSGEYHLLTSMLSLIAKIRENSFIVIDEPEISLHPNWQLKYIGILYDIFNEFPSSHFIIASHSHFIPTNLKDKYSSIIALRQNNGEISSEHIEYSTFGWSPENILYNIFGVITTRNHFFEMDLRNLLNLISSNSIDKNKILAIIHNLEKTQIIDNDPLKIIIEQAKKYANGIS